MLFAGTVFVIILFVPSTISLHVITESWTMLSVIFKTICSKIPFLYTFILHSHLHRHLPLFHFWFELHFLPPNFHLHSNVYFFRNVFYSFFLVIKLKTFKFTFSVLLGIKPLTDISVRVLQLPSDLFKVIIIGIIFKLIRI